MKSFENNVVVVTGGAHGIGVTDLRDLHNRLMVAMDDSGSVLEDIAAEDGVVPVGHEILPSLV